MRKPIHIIPINDLREHAISSSCWCNPDIEDDGDMIVHNSMDGREHYETGERRKH